MVNLLIHVLTNLSMSISLSSVRSIAFVMSPRLGDSLLAMIIVHNLQANGYAVTVFSQHLYALRHWFPQNTIQPYPSADSAQETLKPFDLLLHTYPPDVLFQADQWHPRVVVLDRDPLYRRLMNMVDLQMAVCTELFGLSRVVKNNGLTPPAEYHKQQRTQRIILHPTAHAEARCWLPQRFIALARQLEQQGYTPVFVVSGAEVTQVSWITENGLNLIVPASLDELARLLYESGWFIGNDSGIGHLASNIGVPTVSVMMRRKMMLRWRPSWAPGEALLPWAPLIVRSWKERYWKYFISVNSVLRAFKRLQTRCE